MELYLNAINSGLCYALLALGIYTGMRVLQLPDLTTDGTFTLGGAIVAAGLVHQLNPVMLLLVSVSAGALAGAITGFIHTRLKIHIMLSGIIVMTALYSINLLIMGRSNLPLAYSPFDFTQHIWLWLTAFILLVVAKHYLILTSDFGILLRGVGSNEDMLMANAVNTPFLKIIGLAIANMFTAASGAMICMLQQFADINMGTGIVVMGLAAVMIGEAVHSFFRKQHLFFRLMCKVAGMLVLRLLFAFILTLELNTDLLRLMQALTILLVVLISYAAKKKTA